MPIDNTYHNDNTLQKVYSVLRAANLRAVDVVMVLQNAGILFRERVPEDFSSAAEHFRTGLREDRNRLLDAIEANARSTSLRHQAMEWSASTASGSFLHPDLVIERAEEFIAYVNHGVRGGKDNFEDFDPNRNAVAVPQHDGDKLDAFGDGYANNEKVGDTSSAAEDLLVRIRAQLADRLGSAGLAEHVVTELLNAGICFCEDKKDDGPIIGDEVKWTPPATDDLQLKARKIVWEQIQRQLGDDDPTYAPDQFSIDNVFVVWFCKTLQNWKALVSTTVSDGLYWEVTYDGDQYLAYVDRYIKQRNAPIKI